MHNGGVVAILLVGLILGACQLDQKGSGHADSVLVAGKIFTVNDAQQWAQAVTHYRRALEIRPGFSDAAANLQKVLVKTTSDR